MVQRMFGTNGVRGVVNEDMNTDLALQMGKAIGKFFGGRVAIATDTRVSGDMIKSAVSAGLMATGCTVIDLGTVPTPAIQYYVKTNDDVVGGVMITGTGPRCPGRRRSRSRCSTHPRSPARTGTR